MTRTVYLAGYQGVSIAKLIKAMFELDADLFDVRFSPYSPNPTWQRATLERRLGPRYRHVKYLGNAEYKTANIRLVDYDSGRKLITEHPKPVILLCACKDAESCHRTHVGRRLLADGFSVSELNLANSDEETHVQPTLL